MILGIGGIEIFGWLSSGSQELSVKLKRAITKSTRFNFMHRNFDIDCDLSWFNTNFFNAFDNFATTKWTN
ncbi:hypothetical protein GCM10008106_30660 [Mongoliitalea lutea]|uniref:Uncharacterized protein n=1 Tax=Mongoliitalea lutea TaxID=849756 RepID=A0A8J3CZ68_9BACT|nr:hypothetical protein GCM10008106_30660 [Mongoliitalea lutea]